MNLIRKIKINKITPVLTKREFNIIEYVNDKLKDLIPFEKNQSLFYMKLNGEWIFEIDNNYKTVWINDDKFWRILNNKFRMKSFDIKIFLKFMIENQFKIYNNYNIDYLNYTSYVHSPENDFRRMNNIK